MTCCRSDSSSQWAQNTGLWTRTLGLFLWERFWVLSQTQPFQKEAIHDQHWKKPAILASETQSCTWKRFGNAGGLTPLWLMLPKNSWVRAGCVQRRRTLCGSLTRADHATERKTLWPFILEFRTHLEEFVSVCFKAARAAVNSRLRSGN